MEPPDSVGRTDIRSTVLHLSDSIARIAQTSQQLSSQQLTTNKKLESLEVQMRKQMQELHGLRELQQFQEFRVVNDSSLHVKQEQPADIQHQVEELRLMDMSLRKEQIEMRQQLDQLHQQVSVSKDKLREGTHSTQNFQISLSQDEQTEVTHSAKSVEDRVTAQEHEEEQLSASIWNSVFFIGSPLLGMGGSAVAVLVLCINLSMQIIFCGIVYNKFTEDRFTMEVVSAYRTWRKTTAHDFRNSDPVSGASLASLVCEGNEDRSSLHTSTEQVNVVDQIRSYLPSDDSFYQYACSGPSMCIIALICWFSSLTSEVRELIVLVNSVQGLPSKTSTSVPVDYVNGNLCICSISFSRRLLIFTTLLARAFILAVLCGAGTLYVVHTVSVQELLLNCVALEFVLNVDDLLFAAFAPSRLVHIIKIMLPMKRPKWHTWRDADPQSFAFLVSVSVAVVVIGGTVLGPLMKRIRMAEDNLCGGALSFVYTIGADGMMSWVPSKQPPSQREAEGDLGYQAHSVDEILNIFGSGSDTELSRRVHSLSQMRSISEQGVSDVFNYCFTNRLNEAINSFVYQRILQSEVGRFMGTESASTAFLKAGGLSVQDVQVIDRCDRFQWLCHATSEIGVRMRMFCPKTCGCDDAMRLMFNRGDENGCDDSCFVILRRRYHKLTGTCNDRLTAEINREPFTKELADYKQRVHGLPEHLVGRTSVLTFHDMLEEQGCDAIAKHNELYNDDICDDLTFRWFLHHNCPLACQCENATVSSRYKPCPEACVRRAWVRAKVEGVIVGNHRRRT